MTKNELIGKICEKCYFISTNSKCDVFFRYCPHVHSYEVEYHLHGWKQNQDSTQINFLTTINKINLKRTLKELDKLWVLIEENNLSN